MAEIIRMPKMSDTMEEGVIASWLKKVGDEIKSGDILAEVETDKATMELESYDDGVLLHIGVKDGDSVPVDGVIAIIGEKGEDVDENDSANDRPPVTIVNKAAAASGYSGNLYDIKGATKEGVVYPSADPSIFELKFPSLDIEGKVVGDSTGGTSAGGSY